MLIPSSRAASTASLLLLLCSATLSFAVPSQNRALEVPWKHSKRGLATSSSCDGSQQGSTRQLTAGATEGSGTGGDSQGSNTGDSPGGGYNTGGGSCQNGPNSRQCWGDYSINDDVDVKYPNTGRTVTYDWVVTNTTLAPDGFSRPVMIVNGQYPGPVLEANWGDDIEITVTNNLQSNGTGIHWHGIRQLNSNEMDGTAGITECPIPPGGSKTYRFKATQYGTSWYHSHYSVQYDEGVLGPIVIHGPATQNYDIDLGALPITDWFYTPSFTINAAQLHARGPPIADNMLVNGSMTSASGGKYAVTKLTPGKSHLLRFVNTGINQWVNVALDGHPFTVIASDFVPVVPYTTNTLTMAVGQRYDVIIHANQTVGNYWLRVGTGGGGCDGPNANAANIRSIFRYQGAPDTDPNSQATVPLSTGCDDETNLVPWVKTQVPTQTPKEMSVKFNATNTNGQNLVQWLINDSPIHLSYSDPTIQQVLDGVDHFNTSQNVYDIGAANEFQYWVIQNDPANLANLPHPIHLHGHDFYVLDQKANTVWSGDTSSLKMDNPIRRDTATLPASGYLVLAFESDNPGIWLMHCHIPFHLTQGFGVQFAERRSEISSTIGGRDQIKQECANWAMWREKYYPDGYTEGDITLRKRGLGFGRGLRRW